ncbi:hypothetical protein ACERK3_08460 [Phycisphaerales bacterium AB-hyl4]|uniref:Uncharacterized protein n=1 Tax=Natronomicrosphaera hydrolytica TaxID=3242702 RepID=A0ABV4U472_9BACT
MSRDPDHPVERLFAALPGWMFLLGALSLMAMTLITPPWLHGRDLAWKQELMHAQLDRLTRQQDRYKQFHASLVADDPILLERLAFTQLRLKPTDRELLDPMGGRSVAGVPLGHGEAGGATIEAWLAEPMPVVGVDVPARTPIETRLTRLTQGRNRLGLLAAALLCLLGALWYGPASTGRRSRD